MDWIYLIFRISGSSLMIARYSYGSAEGNQNGFQMFIGQPTEFPQLQVQLLRFRIRLI